mgnify:CR=1 FL=1
MSTNTSASSTTADYMPLVPMTRNWEVTPDSITIVKVIGKGAFGQVAKAKKGDKLVAVKMLKGKKYEFVNFWNYLMQKEQLQKFYLINCLT